MPVRDTFEYGDKGVGIDCLSCAHFRGPASWPDTERASRCALHKVSLAIEIRDGYKLWEWFCKDFTDVPKYPRKDVRPPVAQFLKIRDELASGVLYRLYGGDVLGGNGYLLEFKMEDLPAIT